MTKLQGKKKAILGLAIVTALLNTAYVEEALAAESVQTRDVMVTASRTEQEVKEAPAASEVITSKDIEKMGAESLAQALQRRIMNLARRNGYDTYSGYFDHVVQDKDDFADLRELAMHNAELAYQIMENK